MANVNDTVNSQPLQGTLTAAGLGKDFSMKCPTFSPEKPELFFKLFRSLLTTQGVTDKVRQFNLVFLQLPTRVQEKCMTLLENPGDDSLDKLQAETLLIFGATEEKKLQKLLTLCAAGDRTCAELLAQIRSLQDANADPNSGLVKHQFFSGLPKAVKDHCSFNRGQKSLDELAEMADAYLKDKASEEAHVNAISNKIDPHSEILTSLITTVNSLENQLKRVEGSLGENWHNKNEIFDAPEVNLTQRGRSEAEKRYANNYNRTSADRYRTTSASHNRQTHNPPNFYSPPQNSRGFPSHKNTQFHQTPVHTPPPPNGSRQQRWDPPSRDQHGDATSWRNHGRQTAGARSVPIHHGDSARHGTHMGAAQQPGQCYYHTKFGRDARRCAPGCVHYQGPKNW